MERSLRQLSSRIRSSNRQWLLPKLFGLTFITACSDLTSDTVNSENAKGEQTQVAISEQTQSANTELDNLVHDIYNVPDFKNYQRIVFIGDSITHGGSYHKDIFLYYATRYPQLKMKYYNAGISGDTAVGTVDRFEEDIAIHQPQIATIMLGMNDVGRWLYEQTPITERHKESFLKQQQVIRQTYLEHMDKLATKLTNIGSDVVFIKPSIYDQTAELDTPKHAGINDELLVFGQQLERLAHKHSATIVDFQTPMLDVSKALQAKDPSATVVSKDRVHPHEAGHLLMAYAFLQAQKESKLINQFVLDAKSKSHQGFNYCPLTSQVEFNESAIRFSCQSQRLPMPLSNAQQQTLDWVPFTENFNQQLIQITNLPFGNYQLTIDGINVGKYTASEFTDGINLSQNANTPMYQQAQKVKELNDKRARASGKIRTIAHVRYRMMGNYPEVDLDDTQAVKAALNKHVSSSENMPWHSYLQQQVDKYFLLVGQEKEIRAQIEDYFEQISLANKPQVHHWQITKLTAL